MNGSGARLVAAALATAFAAAGEMQAPAGSGHDCSRDASPPGIFAQRFDACYLDFPSVAVDAAGDFVVAWHSSGSDARGALAGAELCVSAFTTGPSPR